MPNETMNDPAYPILAGDPVLTDEHRALLWDEFHQSKDPNELEQHLQNLAVPTDDKQPLVVPDDTKQRLIEAKQKSMPVVGPVDKITSIMQKMTELDPKMLDLAESHPNVLKTLTAAATTPEKGSQDAAGGTSGAPKGKQTDGAQKPLIQPDRPDGLPHLPPIDDSMYRVLASDGGLHDVPKTNVKKVFEIDPRAHILNPPV